MTQNPTLSIQPENIDEVTRRIRLTISAELIAEERQKNLFKLQKTVRVDGFRKGKVPLSVVKRMYGEKTTAEATETLCWQQWRKVADENDIKPLGTPIFSFDTTKDDQLIDLNSINDGNPVNFFVEYQVSPTIVLADYSTLVVTREKVNLTDSDVHDVVDRMIYERTSWQDTDQPSMADGCVKCDIEYTVDSDEEEKEPFVKRYQDEEIYLGQETSFFSHLTPYLIGVCEGQRIECVADEPGESRLDNHSEDEQLPKKTANYLVDIKKVGKRNGPILDADFAYSMGIAKDEEDPVAKLLQEVRDNMESQLQNTINIRFRDRLFSIVAKKTGIPVPSNMADAVNVQLRRQIASKMMSPEAFRQLGDNPENVLDPQAFIAKANKQVAISLLLEAVERQGEVSVTDEDVHKVIERISQGQKDPEDFMNRALANQQTLEYSRGLAMEKAIESWLESQVQIKEVDATYMQVMQPDTSEFYDGLDDIKDQEALGEVAKTVEL